MTGLIIAGVDPLEAIRYQIIVMYMLLAAWAVSALVTARTAERWMFDDARAPRPSPPVRPPEPDGLRGSASPQVPGCRNVRPPRTRVSRSAHVVPFTGDPAPIAAAGDNRPTRPVRPADPFPPTSPARAAAHPGAPGDCVTTDQPGAAPLGPAARALPPAQRRRRRRPRGTPRPGSAQSIETVIEGKPDVVRTALTVLLAEGHLLIEDVPGVGKTMLAKTLARSLDCSVRRIQFTPDLLPGDVTGVSVFNQESRDFEFRPGAVFANIVLGDEINRASPKTQSALLECMEERQVTVDGTTYELASPFMVIATQNPVEMEGTYPLPEAQRDRFMARVSMGYPDSRAPRWTCSPSTPRPTRSTCSPRSPTPRSSRGSSTSCARSTSPPSIRQYAVDICNATRQHPDVRLGASPRATLHLRAGRPRPHAALDDRDHVLPDDLQTLRPSVLAHRLILTADAQIAGRTPDTVRRRRPAPRRRPGAGAGLAAVVRAALRQLTRRGRVCPPPRRRRRARLAAARPARPAARRHPAAGAAPALGTARRAHPLPPRLRPRLRPTRVAVDQPPPASCASRTSPGCPPACCSSRTPCPGSSAAAQRFVIDRLEAGGTARRPLRAAGRPARALHDRPGLGAARRPVRLLPCDAAVRHHRRSSPSCRPPWRCPRSRWAATGRGSARRARARWPPRGEDDVIPREYRTGDELRRVHWKSTARSGELMVRREEHPWRTRATVFLDTRAVAHRGQGPASSFEWAVSAGGVHRLPPRPPRLRRPRRRRRRRVAAPGPTGTETACAGPEAEGPLLDTFAIVDHRRRASAPRVQRRRSRARASATACSWPCSATSTPSTPRRWRRCATATPAPSAWCSTRSPGRRAAARRRTPAPRDAAAAAHRPADGASRVCGPHTDLAHAWRSLARAGVAAGGAPMTAPSPCPPASPPGEAGSRAAGRPLRRRPSVLGPTVAVGASPSCSRSLALTPLFDERGWFGATLLVAVAVTAAGGIATWLRAPLFLVPDPPGGRCSSRCSSRASPTTRRRGTSSPRPGALDRPARGARRRPDRRRPVRAAGARQRGHQRRSSPSASGASRSPSSSCRSSPADADAGRRRRSSRSTSSPRSCCTTARRGGPSSLVIAGWLLLLVADERAPPARVGTDAAATRPALERVTARRRLLRRRPPRRARHRRRDRAADPGARASPTR